MVGAGSAAGPALVALPAGLREELVAWARSGLPNEACGIVAGDRAAADGGRPLRFHAVANAAASPYRYLIEPGAQLRIMLAIDDAGEEVWSIFHSHVASPAVPSATDIELAFYPEALYLICSLADSAAPVVRAWRIVAGEVTEVPLVVA